ncbi:MAG: hypothetical protein EXR80_03125 [Methylococcales bacterium]|nr:hypothetical protein [Methylococcales bacterium]
MDKQQLNAKLEGFKKTCQAKNYIEGDFYLDEAYPGDYSSYVVKMVIKESWLNELGSRSAELKALLETLWTETEAKTRESIFTIAIYRESERDLIKLPSYREIA